MERYATSRSKNWGGANMQIKIIINEISIEELEKEVNEFLYTVNAFDVKISIKNGDYMAIVMYEV